MVDRPDHFQAMRYEEGPEEPSDENLPRVGTDLVDYLEGRYRERFLEVSVNNADYASDPNWCHDQIAAFRGNMAVIAHLRQIADSQTK